MKREEIEQLLADYITGEISPQNREQLELLLESDVALKTEAAEMLATWQSLNKLEEHTQPGAEMDTKFYAMLQQEKNEMPRPAAKTISINRSWLQAAAIVLLCIAAFAVGRSTVTPVIAFKTKTVFIKQPIPYQPTTKQTGPAILPNVKRQIAKNPIRKIDGEADPVLAQKLRSVYVSERIDAVMQLMHKPKLGNADLKMLQLALGEDPNPNVRLTILNTLRPLTKQPEVQQILIAALNQQGDVLVQSSIVDMLVNAKLKQAIPQMITLLDNEHTDIMVQNKIKGGIESFMN